MKCVAWLHNHFKIWYHVWSLAHVNRFTSTYKSERISHIWYSDNIQLHLLSMLPETKHEISCNPIPNCVYSELFWSECSLESTDYIVINLTNLCLVVSVWPSFLPWISQHRALLSGLSGLLMCISENITNGFCLSVKMSQFTIFQTCEIT